MQESWDRMEMLTSQGLGSEYEEKTRLFMGMGPGKEINIV